MMVRLTGVALTTAALVALTTNGGTAAAQEAGESVVKNRTIGYVMTHRNWAVYITPGSKQECPQGINDGQREQFKILYPDNGTQYTLLDTQLKWEGETWHPSMSPAPEPYPFFEVEGKISYGLNLDGRVDENDFVSPDGEKGIDNQLYRSIGCLAGYNNPQPYMTFYEGASYQRDTFNRVLIELTGVDDLINDDDVTVTTYRGLDALFGDATGDSYLPGGTQRVDDMWGKEFISTFKGRIQDGVLTTDPADLRLPLTIAFGSTGTHPLKDARFQLKLTEDRAEGLIGGYADAWGWYLQINSGWSTHHQNYGQVSSPSLWRSFLRNADAYPDANGQNTALSAAIDVKFARVHIVHPETPVATDDTAPRSGQQAARR